MRLYDYNASGNCYKVRLLLSLIGSDYERVAVDIFAGDTLTPEFGRLNPVRETPVLELDGGEVVTQSNAILWYLAEGTEFLPEGVLDRAHVVQWLSFEQERMMGGIGGARFLSLTGRAPRQVAPRFAIGARGLTALEGHLEERDFVVGDRCSIADVSIFAYAHVAPDAGYDLAAYPAVAAWLDRMTTLRGFIDDLVPYPANASPGLSRSIYD
ncbi:MAG: glutathione S-transferase family protein [Actinobacteria bacterium]|nr:glutathione S-transferase family protein [Actinomycetota bacterium]